jgi:hypothetical protein
LRRALIDRLIKAKALGSIPIIGFVCGKGLTGLLIEESPQREVVLYLKLLRRPIY